MAYKLTINVGGLCMLVQKESEPKGLYILMPKADHHGPPHCPVMITEAANTPGGKALLIPLKEDEDLSSLAPQTTSAQKPGSVLEMSQYAKQAVNALCFTAAPLPCLARKVVLPLGGAMTPRGPLAELMVPSGSGTAKGEFTGIVSVVMDVDILPDNLPMKCKTLTPSGGQITIWILNVPRSEWEGGRAGATAGHPANHVNAYYSLLEDNCTTGKVGPPILHVKSSDAHPGSGDPRCPTTEIPAPTVPNLVGIDFIDPANCTVGYGCETYPC